MKTGIKKMIQALGILSVIGLCSFANAQTVVSSRTNLWLKDLIAERTIGGSTDIDRDGVLDTWEGKYALNTNVTYGARGWAGAYGDPDYDGLANYIEYICTSNSICINTNFIFNPTSPTSAGNPYTYDFFIPFRAVTNLDSSSVLKYAGQLFTDGDMYDDWWETTQQDFSREAFDSGETSDGTRKRDFFTYATELAKGIATDNTVVPAIKVGLFWERQATPDNIPIVIRMWDSAEMMGSPVATWVFTITDRKNTIILGKPTTGTFTAGNNYFEAYIDTNGNGLYDALECFGISNPFAVLCTSHGATGFSIFMTSECLETYTPHGAKNRNGYVRCHVPTVSSDTLTRVRFQRFNIITSGFTQHTILDVILNGRNYIHEGDYYSSGKWPGGFAYEWGFTEIDTPANVYQGVVRVYVGLNDTLTSNPLVLVYTNEYHSSGVIFYTPTNTAVFPVNGQVIYKNTTDFKFQCLMRYGALTRERKLYEDEAPVNFAILVTNGTLTTSATGSLKYMPREEDDSLRVYDNSNVYFGDIGYTNNAPIQWQCKAWTVKGSIDSAKYGNQSVTKVETFAFGSKGDEFTINGSVLYYGSNTNAVSLTNLVVCAYTNKYFSGQPEARMCYQTNWVRFARQTTNTFKLYNLEKDKDYYLMAWVDNTNSANTRYVKEDNETWGFCNYMGTTNKFLFEPRPVRVQEGTAIIILQDTDVDNDGIIDIME